MSRLAIAIGIVISLGAIGCRGEPADPQELLTAHSIGLGDLRKGQLPQAEEQFKKVVEESKARPGRRYLPPTGK